MAVYGAGAAFFAPAFDAIVPDLLPAERLRRPMRWTSWCGRSPCGSPGPAIGGVLIVGVGAAAAFALDAATFVASGVRAAGHAPRRAAAGARAARSSGDLRAGWRYVRRRSWLWATFASAAIAYLCSWARSRCCCRCSSRRAAGQRRELGLVSPRAGSGRSAARSLMGQRGLPRRDITFMYVVWTLATLAVAGYGLATSIWQLMLACLVFNGLETAGTIVWATAKQRHVPAAMLGRVSSLDWLISIGLLPLSFALTGPVSAVLGVRARSSRAARRGR